MRTFGTYVDPEESPKVERLPGGLVQSSFKGTMRVEYRVIGTVNASYIAIQSPRLRGRRWYPPRRRVHHPHHSLRMG